MTQTPVSPHYKAYRARHWARHDRGKVTLLFGGLTWKHERLLQGVLENQGYCAEALPDVVRHDLETGKEFIDAGACCPTAFTTGGLVNFLRERVQQEGREQVLERFAYITAGGCGACRFGQYRESYTLALEGLGLPDFRLFLLDQYHLDQQGEDSALEIGLPFTLGLVMAIQCGDILTDLEYMTRPYELEAGATDRALSECVEILYRAFRDRPETGGKWRTLAWYTLTDHFAAAMREVHTRWASIRVDRLRPKPKVKITGEFWLQTHEGDGNYQIKRWLEQEGAEIVPPPIIVWLDYLIQSHLQRLDELGRCGENVTSRRLITRGLRRLMHRSYEKLRAAVGGLARPLPDQEELARLAAPYYNTRIDGGEGHLLVGKALVALRDRAAHMICELSPYSCLPNSMSVGAMAQVLGQHPELLYAPIEIKGDAEVHAYSRCQMVLAEARKRCDREFADAVAASGQSLEALRTRLQQQPALQSATNPVPKAGLAGTAANFVSQVAACTASCAPNAGAPDTPPCTAGSH